MKIRKSTWKDRKVDVKLLRKTQGAGIMKGLGSGNVKVQGPAGKSKHGKLV